MRILQKFNTALEGGLCKTVFDHLRNYLMCSFLLAIGVYAMDTQSQSIFGLAPSKYTGIGIFGLACVLIVLNLYDGLWRLSKLKHHKSIAMFLVAAYIFFSIRIIEMALNFRGQASFSPPTQSQPAMDKKRLYHFFKTGSNVRAGPL